MQVYFVTLKTIVVEPLHKKGDRTSMTNYMSISLLLFFLKYSRILFAVHLPTPAHKQHTGHRTVVLGKGCEVKLLPSD